MTDTFPIWQRKVCAYITHRHRLLVFSHPHSPEARIQIPGGTVKPGEDPTTMDAFLLRLLGVLPEAGSGIEWPHWDALLRSRGVVVDRAKGSPHPRFSQSRYPVDYGYVPETIGGDGEPIDVFVGSGPRRGLAGAIATRDECKRDEEIKLLWRLTEEEIAAVLTFVNRGQMSGRLLNPPAPPRTSPRCASP